MAAGTFTVLNVAKIKLVNGAVNLSSDAFKGALAAATWTPTAAYTGTSGAAKYSDLGADEVTGTGYTATGTALTSVSLTSASGTVTFTSAAPSWASSTITAKWLVIYDNTTVNKDIIGYMDLNTASGSSTISTTAGTLTVNPNASGWFTLA